MTGFENRLIGKLKPKPKANPSKKGKQLKGKALADYVFEHKEEFEEDGDALCVAAGYGEYLQDGTPNCNLKPFVKELSKVMDLEEKKVDERSPQNQ